MSIQASQPARGPLRRLLPGVITLILLFLVSIVTAQTAGGDQGGERETTSSSRGTTSWSSNATQRPGASRLAGESASGLDPIRVAGAVIATGALLAVAAYALKKFLMRTRLAPRGQRKHLELLDALPLGPRSQAYLLKMHDRILIVGVGAERVELLAEYDAEVLPAGAMDTKTAPATPAAAAPQSESPRRREAPRQSEAPRPVVEVAEPPMPTAAVAIPEPVEDAPAPRARKASPASPPRRPAQQEEESSLLGAPPAPFGDLEPPEESDLLPATLEEGTRGLSLSTAGWRSYQKQQDRRTNPAPEVAEEAVLPDEERVPRSFRHLLRKAMEQQAD